MATFMTLGYTLLPHLPQRFIFAPFARIILIIGVGLPRLLQLSSLTSLSALRLTFGFWTADGHAVLKQLPALRRLVLHSNSQVPECLGELTQIEELVSRVRRVADRHGLYGATCAAEHMQGGSKARTTWYACWLCCHLHASARPSAIMQLMELALNPTAHNLGLNLP